MKKLLFFLAILVYFFAMASCNGNDSQTESTNNDSTSGPNDSVKNSSTLNPPDSNQISYWHIDSVIAEEMKANVGRPGKPSHVRYSRGHIEKQIRDTFRTSRVRLINARYRAADTVRYRDKRSIPLDSASGSVSQYLTKIVEVRTRIHSVKAVDDVAEFKYDYFDIVTICPPPDGQCDTPHPIVKPDTSKLKK